MLEQLLIRFFGTTNNFAECGFLLQNGTMLDFSGRHLGLKRYHVFGKGKWIEHHDFCGTNLKGFSLEDYFDTFEVFTKPYYMTEIMYELNAIRTTEISCTSTTIPTRDQLRILNSWFVDGDCTLSTVTHDGFIINDCYVNYVKDDTIFQWYSKTVNQQPTNEKILTLQSIYGCKAKCYYQNEQRLLPTFEK